LRLGQPDERGGVAWTPPEPGFATRFYQSLALTLSQRLRELTISLPPLIVEDVPQVTRFATERSGRSGHAQLPPTLVDAVEAFKTAMLETDRGLKDRKLAEDGAQLRVGAACDSLETSECPSVNSNPLGARVQAALETPRGASRRHRTRPVAHQSGRRRPVTGRSTVDPKNV